MSCKNLMENKRKKKNHMTAIHFICFKSWNVWLHRLKHVYLQQFGKVSDKLNLWCLILKKLKKVLKWSDVVLKEMWRTKSEFWKYVTFAFVIKFLPVFKKHRLNSIQFNSKFIVMCTKMNNDIFTLPSTITEWNWRLRNKSSFGFCCIFLTRLLTLCCV